MPCNRNVLVLVSALLIASPAPAWAIGGGAGCADLPDYERATGVLEGIPSACDMSVEQAQRIVAQHDGQAAGGPVVQPVAPATHARRKRHRTHPSQL